MDRIERCRDCANLVEINGDWFCDEVEKPCLSTTCPYGEDWYIKALEEVNTLG